MVELRVMALNSVAPPDAFMLLKCKYISYKVVVFLISLAKCSHDETKLLVDRYLLCYSLIS
jgi:hypothetical protein